MLPKLVNHIFSSYNTFVVFNTAGHRYETELPKGTLVDFIQAWKPSTWKNKHTAQQPNYKDLNKLAACTKIISQYPPLVYEGEIDFLKTQLAEASLGKRFLLQGGDCAERFKDCNKTSIENKFKILLQMSLIISYKAKKPVIRVGRIAGQYGKPRTCEYENINNIKIPVYRGDIVNSYCPDPHLREADPERLIKGYCHSALTINFIRALSYGGFAHLHHPEFWNVNTQTGHHWQQYSQIVSSTKNAISFMEAIDQKSSHHSKVELFTSHEGLILPYEEALTKKNELNHKYYNLGAHMLWIGDRTRQLHGGHIEYFRGIENPIGIKVGPDCNPEELIRIIKILNPKQEKGKIVLITRFGAALVRRLLPQFIQVIGKSKVPVCWSCDPMHGNISKTKLGLKTRDFDSILGELTSTIQCHMEMDSILGGVHFELTGENVTECIGGTEGLTAKDLERSYQTYCDPRLNYSQSIEMAFLIASMLEVGSPFNAPTSLQISPLKSSIKRSSPSLPNM